MKTRPPSWKDAGKIRELLDQSNSTFQGGPLFGTLVAENGNGVVGFAIVKALPEAVMALDKDASLRDKVEALKAFVYSAAHELAKMGVTEFVMFTDDPKYEALLKKHFGFVEVKGKALALDLE